MKFDPTTNIPFPNALLRYHAVGEGEVPVGIGANRWRAMCKHIRGYLGLIAASGLLVNIGSGTLLYDDSEVKKAA